MGFADTMGLQLEVVGPQRVEATMPITPALHQSIGLLHGGATIALLETVASVGGEQHIDFATQRSFGLDVHVRHRKPGKQGVVRGIAELDHEEPSYNGSLKQYWNVRAVDEEGDVVSDGVIVTKIVSLEHLAAKEEARQAAKRQAEA